MCTGAWLDPQHSWNHMIPNEAWLSQCRRADNHLRHTIGFSLPLRVQTHGATHTLFWKAACALKNKEGLKKLVHNLRGEGP